MKLEANFDHQWMPLALFALHTIKRLKADISVSQMVMLMRVQRKAVFLSRLTNGSSRYC